MKGQGQLAPDCAEIETLARHAIARLPHHFRCHLDGVVLIVEEFAPDDVLDAMDIEDPFQLSGLYAGRPVGETRQTGDLPPSIHLYRRPILDEWIACGETLERLVTHVIVHEVGHHFGLSDEDMAAIEETVP